MVVGLDSSATCSVVIVLADSRQPPDGHEPDFSYPGQESTGKRGYFLKRLSVRESWHRKKTEPRSDSIRLE